MSSKPRAADDFDFIRARHDELFGPSVSPWDKVPGNVPFESAEWRSWSAAVGCTRKMGCYYIQSRKCVSARTCLKG
jgi:hypothetical protein